MHTTPRLTPTKFLPPRELLRLFAVARPRSPLEERDRSMLMLDYYTGLRVNELVSLNIEHVRDLTQPRHVLSLPPDFCKGSQPRQIPLCPEARQAVEELFVFLTRRGFSTLGSSPLLTDRHHRRLPAREVQRAVQRFAARANLDVRPTPHTLRHSFASRLCAENVPPRVIQLLLGHRRLETTEIYLHGVSDALAQAVCKLSL